MKRSKFTTRERIVMPPGIDPQVQRHVRSSRSAAYESTIDDRKPQMGVIRL